MGAFPRGRTTANGVNVDFMNADGEIAPQHYAFLVGDREFDEIFGRVREQSLPYYLGPTGREMDTKPKDEKPTELDLEIAVFAAP